MTVSSLSPLACASRGRSGAKSPSKQTGSRQRRPSCSLLPDSSASASRRLPKASASVSSGSKCRVSERKVGTTSLTAANSGSSWRSSAMRSARSMTRALTAALISRPNSTVQAASPSASKRGASNSCVSMVQPAICCGSQVTMPGTK